MAEGGGGGTSMWEQTRQHYNSHVRDNFSTREALQQRNEGPAKELKDFHNHVKRQLIMRFAYKQDRVLDLCCGRGGDLQKWRDAQIGYVKGLDISEREVEEAKRRFMELGPKRSRGVAVNMVCEFEAVDWLGQRLFEDEKAGPGSYGVVTCMFALHYFFVSEASLLFFLRNVSANLRHGGYFIATFTSGPRVLKLLEGRPEFRSPMLRLARRWKDPHRPPTFGAGYICDIADTVTASLEGTSEGSLEYLVDLSALLQAAANVGLLPVIDYMDPVLATCFRDEDIDAPFKHFKPFFLHSLQLDYVEGKLPPQPPSSLEKASSLFAACVFQKVDSPHDVSVPMAPECSFMQNKQMKGGHMAHGLPMGHTAPGGHGQPPPGIGVPPHPWPHRPYGDVPYGGGQHAYGGGGPQQMYSAGPPYGYGGTAHQHGGQPSFGGPGGSDRHKRETGGPPGRSRFNQ
ncbi:hypothetical protein VaNZ11_014236 [Volvox africanus]|uniref:mRNA (guanine-N(7))-methyltransferase n=1 Tax=Volvox africanus TaxID=51714 RepID=A0ABQ5SJB9_9CHLO|nr:hypothetical protein VaNZ11_014236 [Volvox africanus]